MLQKINHDFKRPSLLKKYLTPSEHNISFYSVVYAAYKDGFSTRKIDEFNLDITCAFTNKEDAHKSFPNHTILPLMLGKLIKEVSSNERINIIGLNPSSEGFENFIFVPFYDSLTKQYLISPSDEAIALLSIDNKAHEHMGVEATFFSINNKFLPDDFDQRERLLADLVDDLSFMIPRITQPKGSANIVTLILNLENPVEEKAFIRKYDVFDNYIKVLFVTSDLKLQDGNLNEIAYNGESLEGIYIPIIEHSKN